MKQSFRDLIVWQKAMDLVIVVYEATGGFPREEVYGLRSQMRRAAVSIPSNIAEGQAHPTRGEFCQFLGHARGSLAELQTQLLIAQRLGYLPSPEPLLHSAAEVGRLLSGLASSQSKNNH